LEDDQLPVTTMTIDDDDNDNDFNDKVGRKNADGNKPDTNDAMTAMVIPARRNDTGNAMVATNNDMGNATSATSTNTTSAAPTTSCVQFCDQPVQQLAWELETLNIGRIKDSNSKSKESVDQFLTMEPNYYALPWRQFQ